MSTVFPGYVEALRDSQVMCLRHLEIAAVAINLHDPRIRQ